MTKYLKIKTWERKGCSSYYYAERLGIDSIAFVLWDNNTNKAGLIKEFKPPINEFLVTAFGGSLDKECSKKQIVKDEVKEESGYENCEISFMGKSFVSTQMNQWCYLYLVDVTHAELGGREPQTEMEAQASTVWLSPDEVKNGYCWKAITILTRKGVL